MFCCKNIGQNSSKKEIQKKSISMKLKENNHLSIQKQIELYKKIKKEKRNEYNFENEDELTMYAYTYLWNNEPKKALEVFLLIAEQFPTSANAYDSLGEVYLALKNKELSLFNYTKALKMNPDNFNASDQIELINNPTKKTLTPSEKFNKTYSIEGYKKDLDQLGKKLIEVNPSALKFISEKDFWQLIENKKALISKNTTFGEFIWHCNEIIASINCSHTSLGDFYQESSMLNTTQIFPLQTRWVNNKLYVIDAFTNSDKIKIKDEITHINNLPVAKIINNIYKHIQSQGYVKTSKKNFFNKWSTEMIPYELNFPSLFRVKVKGKKTQIALSKAKKRIAPYNDTSILRHRKNLHLDFIDNVDTAILTISSFNYYPWNNLNEFEDFISNSFKKINEKKTKNLVIDLRFNGGGSAESSIYLLKHLVNKPFTYFSKSTHKNMKAFSGNMYFIIDGNGKSTTGHFMSKVKELNLGKVIGEELGSNHFCTAGQSVLRLKNTKLVYYVANTASSLHSKFSFDYLGVQPDIFITQSIDDYLNNHDTVKTQTLNLIKNEK